VPLTEEQMADVVRATHHIMDNKNPSDWKMHRIRALWTGTDSVPAPKCESIARIALDLLLQYADCRSGETIRFAWMQDWQCTRDMILLGFASARREQAD